ncbi:MAG TPA: DUF418 domain-containing protein, partial [Chitinophagaceae bacterium]|nr:DUF418 domain-containing protein [Chitinophagaceae bacterium]
SSYTSFDTALDKIFLFLIDSKCFTLLANLFAVGFVLHMNKVDNPARSLYTYRRRLIGLMIIGLAHALLLRNGDILLPYALLTLLVSFFYFASNRTIIIAMVVTFLLQVFVPEIWKWLQISFPQRPAANNGNYWADNFVWVKFWYASAIFYWETTLFFLFSGLLLGRVFIQKKTKLSNSQLIFIAVTGLIAGSASYWILSYYTNKISGFPDIGNTQIARRTIINLLWLIHRGGLAAAYASLFYLLLKRFALNTLAALGRTSLTNYILQAIIVVPVCLLFNLFDHITPTIALIMTASIWIVQVLFSTWWLKYHRFGPLEWLLRRFTYGKMLTAKKIEKETDLVAVSETI